MTVCLIQSDKELASVSIQVDTGSAGLIPSMAKRKRDASDLSGGVVTSQRVRGGLSGTHALKASVRGQSCIPWFKWGDCNIRRDLAEASSSSR